MDISIPLLKMIEVAAPTQQRGAASHDHATGVATLDEAQSGDLSFIASRKFVEKLSATKASFVLVEEGIEAEPSAGQLFLWVKGASLAVARLCEEIARSMWPKPPAGIHPLAVVDATASIDPTATIDAFVAIGAGTTVGARCLIGSGSNIRDNCAIGADSWLSGNVTLERDTQVGQRVRLHAGVVLGSDGFGYEFSEGRHEKIPQIGSVIVGDDVEIGANTAVDRGRFSPTRIGDGTKIDNLVQIGHNCILGKHCILCSQVGLSGSTTLGDYVIMGGKSGTAGHLKIGSGAQMAALTGAYGDLEGNRKYGGSPAKPLIAYQRLVIMQQRVPELFKRLKSLEAQALGDTSAK